MHPLGILEKSADVQVAFAEMATRENISITAEKALQRFTACFYGLKGDQCQLNEYRYKVVERAFSPKPGSKNMLDKLGGIDGCLIPPCEAELSQHIRRFFCCQNVVKRQLEHDCSGTI